MSSFVLKVIAIIAMFCDHFGDFYFDKITVLNYIGRIAFPIFAFQITQGYIHTQNLKKYIYRLTLFAFISQIPYMIFYYPVFENSTNLSSIFASFSGIFEINVIFTLLFGLLTILIYDKYNKFVGFCSCIFLGTIAQAFHFDYGFWGVFIVFMFYLLNNYTAYLSITFIISTIAKYYLRIIKYGIGFSYIFLGNQYSLLMYSTCLSLIPILLYNGKKGKDAKYLFYIFYPAHLIILGLLKLYLIK